jgi:hypothetical protein
MLVVLGAAADKGVVSDQRVTNLLSPCRIYYSFVIGTVLVSPSIDPRLLYIPSAQPQYAAAVFDHHLSRNQQGSPGARHLGRRRGRRHG